MYLPARLTHLVDGWKGGWLLTWATRALPLPFPENSTCLCCRQRIRIICQIYHAKILFHSCLFLLASCSLKRQTSSGTWQHFGRTFIRRIRVSLGRLSAREPGSVSTLTRHKQPGRPVRAGSRPHRQPAFLMLTRLPPSISQQATSIVHL